MLNQKAFKIRSISLSLFAFGSGQLVRRYLERLGFSQFENEIIMVISALIIGTIGIQLIIITDRGIIPTFFAKSFSSCIDFIEALLPRQYQGSFTNDIREMKINYKSLKYSSVKIHLLISLQCCSVLYHGIIKGRWKEFFAKSTPEEKKDIAED